MEVKRFFSTTMQDVLKMVREELGPDAVILSNSKVEGGVEIVAALDYEEELANDSIESQVSVHGEPSPSQLARMHAEKHVRLQKEMDSARKRIEGVRTKRQKSDVLNPAKNQQGKAQATEVESLKNTQALSELSDMRAEILEIKGLINGQPKRSELHLESRSKSMVQQQIEKTLDSLCLSSSIQKNILNSNALKSAVEDLEFGPAWEKISHQIESAVHVEHEELIDRGGVIALVGPTGSGKTMTIGKMAAQYVMKYGSENVALVTTDRFRIAAHEQLKVFGRILNVPVHTVDERHGLDTILGQLKHKKLVLIDTAGLMHSDVCWSEQLQELKMSTHKIKNYLVVSSVGQYQVMCSTYQNYKVAGLAGAIITKVDEAVSLGEVLSFLIDTRLKASYFTDGQRVPEDIHLFDRHDIFERAQALLNSSERWVTINPAENESDHSARIFHSA